jgi:hypothetical protein
MEETIAGSDPLQRRETLAALHGAAAPRRTDGGNSMASALYSGGSGTHERDEGAVPLAPRTLGAGPFGDRGQTRVQAQRVETG